MCLSADELKLLLSYNASTGVFTRNVTVRGRWLAGTIAGTPNPNGSISIRLPGGRRYLAHRLAWFYCHGIWPVQEIDHKNGIRSDNRIDNLRDIHHRGNMENIGGPHKNNRLGVLGVDYVARLNKFRSRLCVDGKKILVGWFDTASCAAEAYLRAKEQHHLFSNRLSV